VAGFAATRIFRPAPVPVTPTLAPSETAVVPAPEPVDQTAPRVAAAPVVAPAAPVAIARPIERPSPAAAPAVSLLEDVVSAAVPAVVSIETRGSRGSGFFVSPGVIITNNHVLDGNTSVTVRLSTGRAVPGRVGRTSSEADLAIVRVDNPPAAQTVLQLGSAADVRVGQEAIAIGLAMGEFQGTVTRGIISAVRRTGTNSNIVLLQTDAAINPGNSGGPLLDRRGRVIGITTLKVTGGADSLGFAIAADHARAFLDGNNFRVPTVAADAARTEPLAPAFTATSESQRRREEGLRLYQEALQQVATRAAQIDSFWLEIKSECGGRVSGRYEREWFAVWDNRVTLGNVNSGCYSGLTQLNQAAEQVRTTMNDLHEATRRAGVRPGDLRRVRSQYRLDWVGWGR
jgi:V8-like Glu-specific endopeptidase